MCVCVCVLCVCVCVYNTETAPECQGPLLRLLGQLGTCDSVTARDVAHYMLTFCNDKIQLHKTTAEEIEVSFAVLGLF